MSTNAITTATTTTTTTSTAAVPAACSGKHKTRVFVGEGNFTYTESVIKKNETKHPGLVKSIFATELYDENYYRSQGPSYPVVDDDDQLHFVRTGETDTLNRIERIKAAGAKVILGLDGRKLHENPLITAEAPIPRIHWNLPLNDQSQGNFSDELRDFFYSCSKVQEVGHRVHITLLQGENKKRPSSGGFAPDWIFQQGYKAHLVEVATLEGYKFLKKRKFIQDDVYRYPGYITRNSFSGKPLDSKQIKCVREFVFEKQPHPPEIPKNPTYGMLNQIFQDFVNKDKVEVKLWQVKPKADKEPTVTFYYQCETDDDSSDYSDSESKISAAPENLKGGAEEQLIDQFQTFAVSNEKKPKDVHSMTPKNN